MSCQYHTHEMFFNIRLCFILIRIDFSLAWLVGLVTNSMSGYDRDMKKCSQSLGLCLNHTTLLIFEILAQSFSLCYIIEYSPPLRPKWVEHCA